MTLQRSSQPVGASPPASKAARLKALITSPQLEFLMEAHDGISAKIVEEAGFTGIWASGLAVSAALGVRDNNEASWTQVLEVLEFMSDATSIPILVDGDTGYGNFNNVRRAVKKLCQRGIAGVSIEDKLFPKTNSFLGEGQPLADIDEFCGKIKAGKDSQTDPDFCLVARTEALISGWGLDEALKRAEAYHRAGADALLIHSKQPTADEVLAFKKEWGDRAPVVLVPTTYYATSADDFRAAGISVAIWANQTLRASITAMREACAQIQREESTASVEPTIVGVRDVFDLQGNAELAEAELRYLPQTDRAPRGILLAASRGQALGQLTLDRPKCMIDIHGQPLLRRLVATLQDSGLRDVTVVRGYHKEKINLPGVATVDNDLFASTGEVASLACALDRLAGDCVIGYGDILFRHHILNQLLAAEGDIVVTVDALWRDRPVAGPDEARDLVQASRPFSTDFLDQGPVFVNDIGTELDPDLATGEWVGLAKVTDRGAGLVRAEIESMRAAGEFQRAGLPRLFARLVEAGHDVHVVYVTGQWLDVDDAFGLEQARDFL